MPSVSPPTHAFAQVVTSVTGSLRYPSDYNQVVQNVSTYPLSLQGNHDVLTH